MDSHSCEGGNQPNLRWPWGPSKDIQGVRMKPPWISLGKAAYLLPPLPRHHHMAICISWRKAKISAFRDESKTPWAEIQMDGKAMLEIQEEGAKLERHSHVFVFQRLEKYL